MLYLFISIILGFAPTSHSADSSCSWRKNYGNNYLDSRKKFSKPEGVVRRQLEENKHYIYLSGLKNPGVAEAAEKKAMEQGLLERHAYLTGLRAAGTLSPQQQAELFAYDETDGNGEAGRLALKLHTLTKVERARYQALMATRGDLRAAFLAEQDALGLLKNQPGLRAELKALLQTRGDRRYADLKKAQAEKKSLNTCEQEELAFIDDQVKTPSNAEAKADRLPAIVDEPAENLL